MKKYVGILFVMVVLLFMGCTDGYYITQHSFSADNLAEISPPDLNYGKKLSKNWWSGTYHNRPVLIHANVTSNYVNVSFQFVDGDE